MVKHSSTNIITVKAFSDVGIDIEAEDVEKNHLVHKENAFLYVFRRMLSIRLLFSILTVSFLLAASGVTVGLSLTTQNNLIDQLSVTIQNAISLQMRASLNRKLEWVEDTLTSAASFIEGIQIDDMPLNNTFYLYPKYYAVTQWTLAAAMQQDVGNFIQWIAPSGKDFHIARPFGVYVYGENRLDNGTETIYNWIIPNNTLRNYNPYPSTHYFYPPFPSNWKLLSVPGTCGQRFRQGVVYSINPAAGVAYGVISRNMVVCNAQGERVLNAVVSIWTNFFMITCQDLVTQVKGYVYIVQNDGLIIADSSGEFPVIYHDDGTWEPKSVYNTNQTWIRESWQVIQKNGMNFQSISFDDKLYFLLGYTIQYADSNWTVVQLMEQAQFTDSVTSYSRKTIITIICVSVVALLFSLLATVFVTQPLFKLSQELQKVSRMELDLHDLSTPRLFEVNKLHKSFKMMHAALSSFKKFVPEAVIANILKTNKEAVPELRMSVATVMFQDICNFTSLSETTNPTDLAKLTSEYMEAMSNIIISHGGCIDKYIGDCIMSFFNLPEKLDKHEERACMAALECQAALVDLNRRWQMKYNIQLSQRIGVHTGRVLVGNMGSTQRMNYTVIGDNVNVASRMEGANKHFGTMVLVTSAVKEKISNKIRSRKISTVRVSGKSAETAVYELTSDVSPQLTHIYELYEKALEAFEKSNIVGSLQYLSQALGIKPKDGPSLRLQSRAEEAQRTGRIEIVDNLTTRTKNMHSPNKLVALLLLVGVCLSAGQDFDVTRAALIDFWTSTGGLNWNFRKHNWNNASLHYSQWDGITVDPQNINTVTAINLRSYGLSGIIPASLSNLTSLTSLDIGQNYVSEGAAQIFKSTLFSSLTRLSIDSNLFYELTLPCIPPKLVFLNISGNAFYSNLPLTSCGSSSQLQEFHAAKNEMTFPLQGQSSSILSQLRILEISGNYLSGGAAFDLINMLPSTLQVLSASSSAIQGDIPSDLSRFTNLVNLDLSVNNLTGSIPSNLFQIQTLNTVDLSQNDFSQMSITGPSPVTYLDVSNCNLNGSLPNATDLAKLTYFNASDNYFSGPIPSDWTAHPKLQTMSADYNDLTGGVPPFSAPNLKFVSLCGNMLSGAFPLMTSSSLDILRLSDNFISGNLSVTIPSTLTELSVGGNLLNGTVPAFTMTSLNISYNLYSGAFPRDLKGLNYIYARGNRFSGSIPDTSSAGDPPIQVMDLSQNQFTSFGSSGLRGFRYLYSCNVSNNLLTGRFPSLASITPREADDAIVYDLSHNSLLGWTSTGAADWAVMNELYLSNNQIADASSVLSAEVIDLSNNLLKSANLPTINSKIRLLNLSHNQLDGPFSVVDLTAAVAIDLSYNNLPSLYDFFGSSASPLRFLDFSHNPITSLTINFDNFPSISVLRFAGLNRLSMRVPDSLGSIKLLEELDISGSFFHGDLPTSLADVAYLRYLNVSHNRITGNLPGRLKYLSIIDASHNYINDMTNAFTSPALTHLDLSNNLITGSLPSAVADLPRLQYLSLSNNQMFGSLPDSLSSLSSIALLNLSHNQFGGRIPELMNMPNLNVIDVSNNNFSSLVPFAIGSPNNTLETVFLQNNNFTGFLSLGGHVSLNVCRVYDNPFVCPLPSWVVTQCNATCTHDNSNSGSDSFEIRLDGTVSTFNQTKFVDTLSTFADVSARRIKIDYVRSGSVIVGVTLTSPNDTELSLYQGSSSSTVDILLSTLSYLPGYSVLNVASGLTSPPPRLSKGAIAGIAVGASVFVIAIIIIIVFLIMRSRRDKETVEMELSRRLALQDDVMIRRKIAEGHFGDVYEGEWQTTTVAMKSLKDSSQQDTWMKEIKILSQLNHPNIVRLLGLYTDRSEKMFMILEFLQFGSLDQFLRRPDSRNLLGVLDLLFMCIEVTKGMNYLQSKGMIHRDLSARNLLVTQADGLYRVKISDFGMSKEVETYKSSDTEVAIKWAAPELMTKSEATIQSDVWSFGVVMWEVFSYGSAPYSDLTNQQVIDTVIKGSHRLDRPKNIPDGVYDIMLSCWQIESQKRPTFTQLCGYLSDQYEELGGTQRQLMTSYQYAAPKAAEQNLYAFSDHVVPNYHTSHPR
ncbi:hypothetical protein PROFUN_14054 [Planoprotostelium fungivorum]|uniref:Uncharacterized protein n=1 Tax=Planoprotostelium fungivorum TaxID=1890364 RepID=A0A2P6N227_9EUKA|nr:hypothetical protein PROFUN_14054 [Planoprotostelium fungivorum]